MKNKRASKPITDFKKGEKMEAIIVDIKPGEIVIRTNNETLINAKSDLVPNAHIGDKVVFIVKDNINGKISLMPVDNGEKRDFFDIRM